LDLIEDLKPDEVYNLAAPSFPARSWDQTVAVGNIAGLGVARLLEALLKAQPKARFYQASSLKCSATVELLIMKQLFTPAIRMEEVVAHRWSSITVTNITFMQSVDLFNHESPS
jgi:GDPmannose 4,6-dehydratase